MRGFISVVVGISVAVGVWGQADAGEKLVLRYRIPANYDKYPQDKPNTALSSAVKAIELGQIDYLLAHLADPAFVDKRIQEYRAQVAQTVKDEGKTLLAFDRLVSETRDHFKGDPALVKELQQFARSGTWETKDNAAEAHLATIPSR
ncbi:MAG TPA: hypothetical protein VGY66_30190, partial [Gemmataceae bacterium]|nr:hypothetical protein [Gemmataceae bacterium]